MAAPSKEEREDLVRCPQCAKVLGSRAVKGKFEIKLNRGKKSSHEIEIVVGAVKCPRCSYLLRVPVSALEAKATQKPSKKVEAPDARRD